MPELPEMRALSERLDALLKGTTFEGAVALQFSALKTFAVDPGSLVGGEVVGVDSRGKYLVLGVDGSKILVHLGQAGRLDIEEPPKTTRSKLGVVRLLFSGGVALLVREFGTQRKAGWWVLAPGDDGPLAKLGPEPWSEEMEEEVRSTTDGRRLNTYLRDQRTIAGIGRGYADEIAHQARLSPFATVGRLSSEQREGLLAAIRESLELGLSKERKRSGGLPDKLDGRFAIHGHFGHPCPGCNSVLQRVSYESHEIVYCPECQTGGKVLADRRMSRIVR